MKTLAGTVTVLTLVFAPAVGQAQVRGDAASIAAAERLLDRVGGRAAWSLARSFIVEEQAFLLSGEVARLRIWRDFETGARRLERTASGQTYVEWLSAEVGWEIADGVRRTLPPEELAIELQGLQQEPYAVYRRLAKDDPALRFELRNRNELYVYDRGERLLCWFLLDGAGAPTSWGNFWNGRINQHYYGPLVDVGDANLPAWGVSTTGSFRFAYVAARMENAPVEPPPA